MSSFDPYHKWLGIPPKDQPPNRYRLLAIDLFESDPDVIASAADQRMAHVRLFQTGKDAELSQRILNELASARVCLLNPEKKAEYDSMLRALLGRRKKVQELPSSPPPPPPSSAVFPLASPPQPAVPIILDPPSTAHGRPLLANEWFYRLLGNEFGPFTLAEMQELVRAKTIGRGTLVKRGVNGKWMLADALKGLFPDSETLTPIQAKHETRYNLPSRYDLGCTSPGAAPKQEVPLVELVEIPSVRQRLSPKALVPCAACSNRVSQSARSCPKCGHVFEENTMNAMKDKAYGEQQIKTGVAIGCTVIFLVMFVWCSGDYIET